MATNDALNTGVYPLAATRGGTAQGTYATGDILYASAANTLSKLTIGSAGQILTTINSVPAWQTPATVGVRNLGLSYAGGTLTVNSASGAALSATNPGFVTLQSKTYGNLITIAVTANQTCTDGAAGTTDNARFGLASGADFSSDLPFFVYALLNDAENSITFCICRSPQLPRSPASTSISKSGAIINVAQDDMFAMGDPTVTDLDNNPCLCIGSFRGQFIGATNSWTFQALSDADGIGNFHEENVWDLPAGVFSAKAGSFFYNANTVPIFATQTGKYKINRQGIVQYTFTGTAVNNTPANAVDIQPILPFKNNETEYFPVYWYDASTANNYFGLGYITAASSIVVSVIFADGTSNTFQNATFETDDNFGFTTTYWIF
jgi:hypothetical protein